MRDKWIRFFLFLLPAALIGFSAICEGLAYELRGIQPFQTSLDSIVVAAEREKIPAEWLIFGDSTVQHVLMDYTLGPPEKVANLTTHAGAGMPSIYLLLQRYLTTHVPPRGIIIALTPESYSNVPDEKTGDFWLTPIFRKPDEQAWLGQFYNSARTGGWRPASTDIKNSILDPATGLLAPKQNQLSMGTNIPSPNVPVEAALQPSATNRTAESERAQEHLALGSSPRIILADICRVARQKGFGVHLLMAPIPDEVSRTWESRGELGRLKQEVELLARKECGDNAYVDLSQPIKPPNFDDDGTHILGSGWENRYALSLKKYIDRGGESLVGSSAGD